MEADQFWIPQYLDEPERILFFTLDEAMILFSPFVLGIVMEHLLIGLLLGIAGLYSYRKLKGTHGKSVMLYAKYWYLPASMSRMIFTPPSHIRFYQG